MLMLSIGGITMASWLMMMACMQTAIPPIMLLGTYCTTLSLEVWVEILATIALCNLKS